MVDSVKAAKRRDDVTLAPIAREHAARMLAWMRDPEVAANIGLKQAPSSERTAAWIERALTDATIRAFAILRAGEHVGNVVLDQLDEQLGAARLSIYIGEAAARGGGVGRTALALLAEHAFGALGLHKIWLTVHARNAAAIKLYLDAGFTIEGVLRDEFVLDGRRLAALRMGLLAGELRP
jgi:RimJ/RimL family protein N-acetyltransferase